MNAAHPIDPNSYESIIQHGLWLESRGHFSRYAVGNEESVWINECEERIEDPECPEDEADPWGEDP